MTPFIKTVRIQKHEIGLHFHHGQLQALLREGRHTIFDPFSHHTIDVVSMRAPWLVHEELNMMVRSGLLEDHATTLDLKDHQRGLVWVDGRFDCILTPGLYAYWNGMRDVRVETIDASEVRFDHQHLNVIEQAANAAIVLDVCSVQRHCVGVLFIDGKFVENLDAGRYAFWKRTRKAMITEIDLRETMIDVSGQEIMTLDKVTLRLNVVVTYKVVDPRKSVRSSDDSRQSLYRETQLVVRGVVGTRTLDDFLTEKDAVAADIASAVRVRSAELGLEVASVGIRDVILPGEMKELMNKVTEARKAAEANLISRREETAAMRSQANTAKVLADNPTLMRLRELEVLETIATSGKLNVVLGEKGLADRVTNLL